MSQMPLVTIIIPFVYEVGYLREALQSALDQCLDTCQILLVCNAPEMVHVDVEPPFDHGAITWLHEPAPGAPHARNMGLAHATGEWIQFLDVDDLLLPDKISTQLNHHTADVIVSPATYCYINGKEKIGNWNSADVWYALLASQLGSTSSMLWKRSALQLVGGWNPEYQSNQEYELLFRLLKASGKIAFEEQARTIVRQRHAGSITLSRLNNPVTGINLRVEIWNYLISQGLDTELRQNAYRTYIFKNLRGLFRIDRKKAMELYKAHFSGSGFIPDPGIPGYILLYKLTGFSTTEKIMHQYRVFRDQWLPGLPKNE